ncbi:MAG: DUF2240 family protein [Candidatus Helarchaeota archaeon]
MNSNLEDVINELVKKTNVSKKEIKNRIDDIKKDFDGLLSDEGALAIIAKEQGIEMAQDLTMFERRLNIDELEAGMRSVSIAGRVNNIYPIREFKKKSGVEGKVVNFILSDKTGSIRATLWDDHVRLVEDGSIKVGQIIELKNCYVKEGWKDQNEITLGRKGEIELLPEVDENDFPKQTLKKLKISEISPDMNNVSIEGRIINISEVKDITTRDGRQTKVQELIVADESGQVRIPVWGSRIENLGNISKGDLIKLENAYSRAGFGSLVDLNIGNSTIIEINPKGLEISEIKDLNFETHQVPSFTSDRTLVKIKDLTTISKNVNLIGKCVEIGEIREVTNENRVLEIKLGDETGVINLSVWNDDIETIKKGESYKIVNGYITTFQNKIQLNTGKFGRLEISEEKITKVNMKNNISEMEFGPTRIKIIECSENQLVEIMGTVVDYSAKTPTYNACPNCSKKVSIENGEIICPKCGKVDTLIEKLLFSFILDDGSGNIRVTAIGETAEKLLNIGPNGDKDLINYEKILGKEIIVVGKTQKNKFSDQIELIVRKIEAPNAENEITEALKKLN